MNQLRSILLKYLIIISSVILFILAFNTDTFPVDTCIDCHKDEKFRIQYKKLFDYYNDWKGSVHDVAGVSCHDCHGGNPDATNKEKAHVKNLSPGNASSTVFYKNIPKTCGKCHEKVYGYFVESKHFKALEKAGRGPTCVTCHGSLVTNVYYTSIVLSTCVSCHNQQNKNYPEVISSAEQILHRLNVSMGYLKWSTKHFDPLYKITVLKEVIDLYKNISDSWHQFDFTNTDRDSEKLLSGLKTIFNEAYKKKKE